jgi:hypothetical protein
LWGKVARKATRRLAADRVLDFAYLARDLLVGLGELCLHCIDQGADQLERANAEIPRVNPANHIVKI